MRILALSGSLRAGSSNAAVLRAAAAVAPEGVEVVQYEGVGGLPHFNPDLDVEPADATVADFRARLRGADAVLVCCPEYAHGVPGAFKNALDWVVGSGEFVGKPVALINASPRSTLGQASLAETLRVMTADLVDEASIALKLPGKLTEGAAGIVADPSLSAALRGSVEALARAAESRRALRDESDDPEP